MNEEKRHCFMKYLGIVLATLLGSFLAFYVLVDMTVKKKFDPMFQMRRAEKRFQHDFRTSEKSMLMPIPAIVHIVKDNQEYKIIVDLRPLNNDEKNVRVNFDKNTVTVSGAVEKDKNNRETVLSFTQSYLLDSGIDVSKVTKERHRNKYIITIPYSNTENDNEDDD